MKTTQNILQLTSLIIVFIGIPLVLYYLGDFPQRNVLMEAISITTILAFSLLISQFFSSRLNYSLMKKIRMVKLLAIHKFIGYFFISVMLLHPFFIVIPKFFDEGVTPADAFVRLITTFSSKGIILGLVAYASLLILMVTAFFRFKLYLPYRTWRTFHGLLTLIFVIAATWHVINMGRHINLSFTIYFLLVVAIGMFYILKKYLFKTLKV